MYCTLCEVLYINGIKCHETGCPESWRDYKKKCFECGYEFCPETRWQRVCEDCVLNIADAMEVMED